jgi:hypothetical protein
MASAHDVAIGTENDEVWLDLRHQHIADVSK